MRSKKISLILVPLLITACSNDDTLVQDVYNNQYDCSYDWDPELCEQEQSSSSHSHGSGYYGHYLGPQYYRGNREVSHLGQTLTPRSNLSVGSPIVSQVQKSTSRSSPIRGGFGRSGFSFGG